MSFAKTSQSCLRQLERISYCSTEGERKRSLDTGALSSNQGIQWKLPRQLQPQGRQPCDL